MLPEIGSNFWLNPNEDYSVYNKISLSQFQLKGKDKVFLSTGRAAERLVLEEIKQRMPAIKKIAIVPPYTCHTVIEPFLVHGFLLHTYPVNEKMQTSPTDLEEVIRKEKPSVVLLHRYFGLDTLKGCEDVIRKYSSQGVLFIEDGTQSLFSKHKWIPADYYVGSIRKWTGMPDGGYAICKEGFFHKKPDKYDKLLTNAKLKASYAKYEYIFNQSGNKQDFLEMYGEAETILNAEKRYYLISPVSEAVFMKLDFENIAFRRRENYTILYKALQNIAGVNPVFGELDANTVPLYFPIIVKDRKSLQIKLRDNNIYAPVVWPKPEKMPMVCGNALMLYENVLCIPIDQRYVPADMERIIKCIKG